MVVSSPSVSSYPVATAPRYVSAPVTAPFVAARVPTTAKVQPTVAPIHWKQVIGVKTGERPLVVWVSGGSDFSIEQRTFDDDAVRLASLAFRTVRITPSAARADAFLAQYASSPTMLVFSPNLTRVRVISGGALDARTALDAMRVAAKSDLDLDLDAALVKARALISEEKVVIGRKAEIHGSEPADVALTAELDRQLASLRAEEEAVFRAPPKGAPTAPPAPPTTAPRAGAAAVTAGP